MPTMSFKPDHEGYGFLCELTPLFGSPRKALEAILQTLYAYHVWRGKTAYCPHCHRHVILDAAAAYDEHCIRNPEGDLPYWISCPRVGTPAQLRSPNPSAPEVALLITRIEHHVRTMQPGLL